jgi:hypothetical protein
MNELYNPDDSFPPFDNIGSCVGTENEGLCSCCIPAPKRSYFLNPILVLAASAARGGNSMFADSLLDVGRGRRDCKSIRKSITRLRGNCDLNIARITESSLLLTGSPSLVRPKVGA